MKDPGCVCRETCDMERRKFGISQEVLKLIACTAMLLDHFGATVVPYFSVSYMEELYYIVRGIGRIAFPIYAFLLAEGMRHTRNPRKYFLRLGYGILLAEIPFDMALFGGLTWEYQNVMVTLCLGAVMIFCMEKSQKSLLKVLLAVPFAAAAELLCSDYGAWGISMIAVFAIVEERWLQALCITAINWLIPSLDIALLGVNISIQLFGALAMVPIACYSGRKLTHNRVIQWGFYLFYPVHLLVLWLLLSVIR